MIRVLVVDDYPIFRDGVKQVLSNEPGFAPVRDAADAEELLRVAEKDSWDVVLLGVSLPAPRGLDLLPELLRRNPALAVVILDTHAESQIAVRALKLGAKGYLTKSTAPNELVHAIRHVANGRKYISLAIAEMLVNTMAFDLDRCLHDTLSNRETLVLRKIAEGKSVSEIAQESSLSMKTISTYRVRLLDKMGMRSNAELIRYADRNGLVQ